MRIKRIGAVVVSLTIALGASAGAQETLDSSVSHVPGAHDLARNTADGDFLVAWAGMNVDQKLEIRAHRLDPSGDKVGTTISVDPSSLGATEVSVAYGEGRYLVAWRDGRKASSNGDELYGRIIATDGNPVGGSFRISDIGDKGPDSFPDVVFDGQKFLVAWAHRHLPPSGGGFTVSFVENDDIRGRYVTVDGTMDAGSFAFTEEAVDSQRPSIAVLSGSPLAVWEDHAGPGTPGQVWGARAPQDLEIYSSFPYAIGSGMAKERPQIVANPDKGQFLVLWRADTVRSGHLLYARLATTVGKYIGKVRVVPGVDAGLNTFSAAYDSTRKEYLVSWDMGVQGSAEQIRAVRLNSSTLDQVTKMQITEGDTKNWGMVSDPAGSGDPLSVYLREVNDDKVELVSGRLMSLQLDGPDTDDATKSGGCSASAMRATPSPIPFLALSILVGLLVLVTFLRKNKNRSSL